MGKEALLERLLLLRELCPGLLLVLLDGGLDVRDRLRVQRPGQGLLLLRTGHSHLRGGGRPRRRRGGGGPGRALPLPRGRLGLHGGRRGGAGGALAGGRPQRRGRGLLWQTSFQCRSVVFALHPTWVFFAPLVVRRPHEALRVRVLQAADGHEVLEVLHAYHPVAVRIHVVAQVLGLDGGQPLAGDLLVEGLELSRRELPLVHEAAPAEVHFLFGERLEEVVVGWRLRRHDAGGPPAARSFARPRLPESPASTSYLSQM
mmetsp:Transcript_19648/g.52155  ORF Transcript_19648/g.52155 Transcript_19648/m.52155 type:complete len:259 (-) Transcript_19648:17-793(-)